VTVDQQGDSSAGEGKGIPVAARPPAERRVPRILFWYMAREFVLPLVCCVFAFVALFLISDLFDVLGDMLGSETASIGQLFVYFAVQQPVNLPQVLPMSVLLSASFMVNSLQRHHELSAMRAAGLSLLVCARPVWILGFVLSIASLWVGEALAPRCATTAERMRDAWTESEEYRESRGRLSYSNPQSRRDWFFSQFNPVGEHQGVLVKQFRPDHSTEWDLKALRAQHVGGEWVFYEGTLERFDDEGRHREGARLAFKRRAFPELDETPARILNQLRPESELSVRKMLDVLRFNPALPETFRQRVHATVWYRLTFPFSCLVGAFLGMALSIAHERGSALRGFALAVGLMVLYYIACQIALVLAQQGHIPAFAGGALPTLVFLGIAFWQMHRKR
jgi:lipopolysaccharide export system permease protein